MMKMNRRHSIALGLAGLSFPRALSAAETRELMWEDLIPPGVPYAEIIGEGDLNANLPAGTILRNGENIQLLKI